MAFENLKTYFRSKKKSGSDLSTTMISFLDPKLRNPEKILDDFIAKHRSLVIGNETIKHQSVKYFYDLFMNQEFETYDTSTL